MQSRTYEITFKGQAGRTLRAQFDDCKVTTHPERTTLRADLPDQAAFVELVGRIVGLGLVVIDAHLLTQPSLLRPASRTCSDHEHFLPGQTGGGAQLCPGGQP